MTCEEQECKPDDVTIFIIMQFSLTICGSEERRMSVCGLVSSTVGYCD